MADARALLRQQREARRITHPHASYSDAGKLLCTLCREIVRSEALWGSHVKDEAHQARAKQQLPDASTPDEPSPVSAGPAPPPPPGKRKYPDGEEDEDADPAEDGEDGIRRKRSKADMGAPSTPASAAAAGIDKYRKDQNLTPPLGYHDRKASVTPAHGFEINIPSRPATPAARRDGSASSTPGDAPSPHISQTVILPRRMTSDSTTNSDMGVTSAPAVAAVAAAAPPGDGVDEAEWAAFEADIAAVTTEYDEGAVVSAPAMTAEEAAAARAKGEDDDDEKRVSGEKILQDEREDAARALEDEFEEMEALEERVQKLKEKREALRKIEPGAKGAAEYKENIPSLASEDEEDEEEDDEDDDWDGFRFQR